MHDIKLERVHFRLPADGISLLEEMASEEHMTDASLKRKFIMEWYDSPFELDVHDDRPKLQATVQLPEKVVADIKELCEDRGITRSALLRNIVMTSLMQEEGE